MSSNPYSIFPFYKQNAISQAAVSFARYIFHFQRSASKSYRQGSFQCQGFDRQFGTYNDLLHALDARTRTHTHATQAENRVNASSLAFWPLDCTEGMITSGATERWMDVAHETT